MSTIALPRVDTVLKPPPIDMTTAILPGGVYAALAIYANACGVCTHHRPCGKHRDLMESDYLRSFAVRQGIDLGERCGVVPVTPPVDSIRTVFGDRARRLVAIT